MKRNNAVPWWGWTAWFVVLAVGLVVALNVHHLVGAVPHRPVPVWLAVFYVPGLMLAILLVWQVLWRIDPRRRNYAGFWTTYRFIGGVVIVGVSLVYLLELGFEMHLATIRWAPTAWGVMFMTVVNVLPRVRSNWWIGVRTPWTLSSEQSWTRTNRLAGQLGIPTGALSIVLAWVLPVGRDLILAIVGPVLAWALVTTVASYFYAQGANGTS
jgi:uncharacterized membrane protein